MVKLNPNWELKNCCNHEQVVFLVTVAVCTVVILALSLFLVIGVNVSGWTLRGLCIGIMNSLFSVYVHPVPSCAKAEPISDVKLTHQTLLLWRTILLRPFKLVTVFLHEASHAIACKLTCGHVEGIQVHADEGGTTQTRGGIYWLILPAGYLGSSFWGMVLILASTNLLTARIAAGCFVAALLIVLCVAKNIYDDLISRRVHSSDAEKFAEVCPCPCNGVGWGVIW
ncbi:hypothetical protein GOBAR_DD12035 [Gossypium barbadense]|nr:hypothetical protein GOBAR_DD12035 [Gossypium barbadense]